MVDLSIVIVNFNTRELLRKCLLSIKKHGVGSQKYEVIIIDNASTDGSIEEILNIKNKISNIEIVINEKNLGYSRANNQGAKIASSRYLLFLNADTLVYPKTLETMVKFMDDRPEVGVATCRVELPNGKLDDSCHRGFPTPWRAFCHFSGLSKLFPHSKMFGGYSLSWMDLDKNHKIDSCSGAFMIVRQEAGEKVGWWDEDYFWYGEDLDFCYRLKEEGWKVYFVPNVKILHYKGVSGGIKEISKHLTIANRETRIRVTNARFDAMRMFYKKHYISKYPRAITWLVMQGINFKQWLSLKTL